jgi:hypothetical protein
VSHGASSGAASAGSSGVEPAGSAGASGAAGSSPAGGGGGDLNPNGGGAGAGGGVPVFGSVSARGTMICDLPSDTQDIHLGEMHIFTNRWTDTEAHECVYLDQDGNFGWSWQRGATGKIEPWGGSNPNYPELEFGINPWNMTGLDQSTTTLLPLQLKDINSASVTVDVETQNPTGGYNLAFEMWFATENPALGTPASGAKNAKAELMVFFAHDANYYPSSPVKENGGQGSDVQDGPNKYVLQYSSNTWADWGIYRQWRLDPAQLHFNGKLDIKKFIDEFLSEADGDKNLWLTRFEIGNEIYQNSSGKTVFKSAVFEVNGQQRAAKTQ